ncbi:MAG: hypothetical protein M1829_005582 [Trizodia sp. TS-e1964]|nr:MAG: hypothetical protein M1829_005582 [Trizodia sp. TS-e1964]
MITTNSPIPESINLFPSTIETDHYIPFKANLPPEKDLERDDYGLVLLASKYTRKGSEEEQKIYRRARAKVFMTVSDMMEEPLAGLPIGDEEKGKLVWIDRVMDYYRKVSNQFFVCLH